jgi:hypothetical protein
VTRYNYAVAAFATDCNPARLNLEFANLVLLDFAAEGGGEVGDEADVLGNFVVGDLALAELFDLFFVASTPGLRRTQAARSRPAARWGMPTTCASPTLGWV